MNVAGVLIMLVAVMFIIIGLRNTQGNVFGNLFKNTTPATTDTNTNKPKVDPYPVYSDTQVF